MKLAGDVALVTGGGAGIGEAIAHRLARDGVAVLVADLLPDRAQRVAAEITAAGLRAAPFTLDVAEEDQAAAAVAEVEARFGPLRLAVCNAGITDRVPALEMSRAAFERVLRTNLTGCFVTAQAAARAMVRHAQGGRIVTTSSVSGQFAGTGRVAYQPVDEFALGWLRRPRVMVAGLDGSGSAAGSSVGNVGGVVGDAALARPRVLRPAAGGAYSRRVRRLRRGALRRLLRRAPGPAVTAAGPLLPHAAGRLLRRHRQRARPGVALRRQPVAAGVPAARRPGPGPGPLLAQPPPRPPAARGPRPGLRLGAAATGRARLGSGR